MHLIETYALTSGSKIGRPYIYEKFFPLTAEKYITIHPISKFDSKSYSYWQEVVDFLFQTLTRNGIKIVQIGTKDDKKLKRCANINGQTNINQIAYILKNSMLHLGVDSFPTHVASHYNRKIVCLYSNNHIEVVKPYWGNPVDHVLLQELEEKKPSFSASESPKAVDNIKPETIVNHVLASLGLKDRINFKTAMRGPSYLHRHVETVPNSVIDTSAIGLDAIIVRMDLLFNEEILAKQLSVSNCCIITNKPIQIDLIKHFAPKIKQFLYILDENHNPAFVNELQKLGINYHLRTEMSAEKLESIKLYYLDFDLIDRKLSIDPALVEKLKAVGIENLVYRSNKFIISESQIFQSDAALEAGFPVPDLEGYFTPAIDSELFWRDLHHFYVMKKA